MTKFLASQCKNGRTVDLPLAGKFKMRKADGDEQGKPQYMFMPHLDFLGSGHFKYHENASNVSPFSKGATGFQSGLVTVSLTSLSAICNFDRDSVATGIKAILVKFIEAGRNGKYAKLDMRIGNIVVYPNGNLSFENYPEDGQEDQMRQSMNDQRFVRRSPGLAGSKSIMGRQQSEARYSKGMRSS